jgi:hypothetical protein
MTNRGDWTLTDATLEQEIEHALAVEPSPEFLARVRTHIASVPRTSGWSMRWPMIVAGSAAVAMMAIAATTLRVLNSQTVVAPAPVPLARTTAEPRSHGLQDQAVVPLIVKHTPRQSSEPEVLIPQGEADALRRLMRGLYTGAVKPPTLADGARASAVVQPTREILIEPLAALTPVTLEPLATLKSQEGVRQ